MRIRIETKWCWLSSTLGSALDPATRRHSSPDEPRGGSASARAVSRRTRQNWLTGHRGAGRRRSNRVPLTPVATRHVEKRSTSRHRVSHRHRRSRGSNHRNRSTQGHRRSQRYWRSYRHRPGQSHWNTSHVSEWSASRIAHARYRQPAGGRRRCTTGLARRRLDASVAAGYQRGGRNVRAQSYSDPAQPSRGSNYSDVESIEDRHRRRLLHSRSDIPHSSGAVEPHAVPKSRLDDRVNYQKQTSTTRHAAPRRYQMVMFGMV